MITIKKAVGSQAASQIMTSKPKVSRKTVLIIAGAAAALIIGYFIYKKMKGGNDGASDIGEPLVDGGSVIDNIAPPTFEAPPAVATPA